MKNTRFATILAVIVAIAVVAGTFFLGVTPRLAEAALAEAERSTVEAQNAAHQAELDRLIALDARLPELQDELATVRTALPANPDTSRFYRELDAIGAATGVRFTDVTLGVPEPYALSPEAAALTEAALNPELAAALGSVNANNFFTIGAQFVVTGGYTQVLEALSQLQNNPRFVLVHNISIEEGLPGGDAAVTANIEGQLFVLLDASDVIVPVEAAPVTAEAAE